MRRFKNKVCAAYATHELPKETASRHRRRAARRANEHDDGEGMRVATGHMKGKRRVVAPTTSKKAKLKTFNLSTYKYHRLGDYAQAIREYGPTDNYTTQTVSALSARPPARPRPAFRITARPSRLRGGGGESRGGAFVRRGDGSPGRDGLWQARLICVLAVPCGRARQAPHRFRRNSSRKQERRAERRPSEAEAGGARRSILVRKARCMYTLSSYR